MGIGILIKKNYMKIIYIGIISFFIIATLWSLEILLNSKENLATIIQFMGVIVALFIGVISALSSWNNNQKAIKNNEKQLKIVEKYTLLLRLDIKLQSIKLKSQNDPIITKLTDFNDNDYENYLTLILIQKILKDDKDVFMLLFPKTLLNYTQFKFTFSENLSSKIDYHNSYNLLKEVFIELFNLDEERLFPSQDLNEIQYPEMIGDMFPRIKWHVEHYEKTDEDIINYREGLHLFFEELNDLIKTFNKEFENQEIKYDLYKHENIKDYFKNLYSKLKI